MPAPPAAPQAPDPRTFTRAGLVALTLVMTAAIGLFNWQAGSLILGATEAHADNQAMLQKDTVAWGAGCLLGLAGTLGYGVLQFLVFGVPGLLVGLRARTHDLRWAGYTALVLSVLSAIAYYAALMIRYSPPPA